MPGIPTAVRHRVTRVPATCSRALLQAGILQLQLHDILSDPVRHACPSQVVSVWCISPEGVGRRVWEGGAGGCGKASVRSGSHGSGIGVSAGLSESSYSISPSPSSSSLLPSLPPSLSPYLYISPTFSLLLFLLHSLPIRWYGTQTVTPSGDTITAKLISFVKNLWPVGNK